MDIPKYPIGKRKVIIHIDSEKDFLNRQSFTTFWDAENVGYSCNEKGVRGQCFFAVLADHVKYWKDLGRKVIIENKVKP